MLIFGFIAYVVSSILISIVQTVYAVNQRALLRTNLEHIISEVTSDVQFASSVASCNTAYPCILMSVPDATSTGVNTDVETIYFNSSASLPSIVKSVTINGSGTPVVTYLNTGQITMTAVTFTLQNGSLYFAETGKIKTGNYTQTASLTLATTIQYNK